MSNPDDLAICVTCGTQYDTPYISPPKSCKICDDPRQYVPTSGQTWTCLTKLKAQGFRNSWTQDSADPRVWFIQSVPEQLKHLVGVNLGLTTGIPQHIKVGIGQRAIFLQTEQGNVLWDCVPFINEQFVEDVKQKGGLKAIVISHPHFYTTHLEWAKAFECPVYLANDDAEWLARADFPTLPCRKFLSSTTEILPGVTAIICGGHFPGSMVLHWSSKLLLADTIMTVPSGLYVQESRQPGTSTYTFMWSYPNMIPLPPDEIWKIWQAVKGFEFDTTYGGFPGQDVRRKNLRKEVLESAKVYLKMAGWKDTKIFEEAL